MRHYVTEKPSSFSWAMLNTVAPAVPSLRLLGLGPDKQQYRASEISIPSLVLI